MKQFILFCLLLSIFLSCSKIRTETINYEKTWVYIELEILTKNDTNNYYYYGQVDQRFLDKLSHSDNYKSLFILTNVRYYNDLDKLQEYEDETDEGILFFRTQDIIKIEVLKDDPLYDIEIKSENDSLLKNNN